jgi:hypothetical protein
LRRFFECGHNLTFEDLDLARLCAVAFHLNVSEREWIVTGTVSALPWNLRCFPSHNLEVDPTLRLPVRGLLRHKIELEIRLTAAPSPVVDAIEDG